MNQEKIKLPIHSALVPVFYRNFHCLAQDCRDSCCVNWSITFDKKDYLRLRRLDAPAGLRERLEKGVLRQREGSRDGVLYGKFALDANNGRCPFLDPDGLCAIQRSCGGDALPNVCRTYPRKTVYTPAAKEYSLSPSCEGVLQQLWDLPDGVEFVEDPLPRVDQRDANIVPEDTLSVFFAPLRGLFIDILQDRSMSLTERMLYLGIVVQRLQKEDWDNFDPDAWVETVNPQADADSVREEAANIQGNREMYLVQNLNVLNKIARGEKVWTAEISRALGVTVMRGKAGSSGELTVQFSKDVYEEALARFQAAFPDAEYFFENLMVASALYMVFPSLGSREALWKSYVSLCSLYSFFRFVAVAGCREEATKERLFHMIVMASRSTLHNQNRFDGFREELFEHNSTTLAHMAILLRWD